MSDYYFNTQKKSTNVRVDRRIPKVTTMLFERLWHWTPGFARWLTLQLFFAPGAYRTSKEEKVCLKQGHAFQIAIGDKIVHAWRWGEGPAILLVHGWSGRGIQFHRFVGPLVEAGYAAIALDMPAHGASSGRITSYFEFTDTVRLMVSQRQRFNVQGIIAHSFGASAVINALVKEKRAIRTVCIAPIIKLQELLLNTFERFGLPEVIYTALISKFEKQFGYRLETDNPSRLMDDLRGPVLLVHDERDRTVAFDESADQAQRHTHLSLYATRGLGHRRILADNAVVRRCLEHLRPPQGAQITNVTGTTGGQDGTH